MLTNEVKVHLEYINSDGIPVESSASTTDIDVLEDMFEEFLKAVETDPSATLVIGSDKC